jgi:hypothetical protein
VLRRAAHLVLVLVLLSGWTAGLLHPLTHADKAGRLVHLDGDPKSPGKADPRCDVLSSLGACLLGSTRSGATEVATHAPAVASSSFVQGGEAPPFFAQGPPASL